MTALREDAHPLAYEKAKGMDDYRTELRKVRGSLVCTMGDLVTELRMAGSPVAAAHIEEAASFLLASLRSMDRTLADLQRKAV